MPPITTDDHVDRLASLALADALAATCTLDEATAETGLSANTLRWAIDRGDLDAWCYGGRLRVDRAGLRGLLQSRPPRRLVRSRQW